MVGFSRFIQNHKVIGSYFISFYSLSLCVVISVTVFVLLLSSHRWNNLATSPINVSLTKKKLCSFVSYMLNASDCQPSANIIEVHFLRLELWNFCCLELSYFKKKHGSINVYSAGCSLKWLLFLECLTFMLELTL